MALRNRVEFAEGTAGRTLVLAQCMLYTDGFVLFPLRLCFDFEFHGSRGGDGQRNLSRA